MLGKIIGIRMRTFHKTLIASLVVGLALSGCHSNKPREALSTAEIRKIELSNQLPDINSHGNDPAGFSRTNYLKSSKEIVKHVQNGDIQVVNEGHRITLILPTDKYFIFDSYKLNDLKFKQLNDITTLIKCFPNSTFYVAGFTDDVGNYEHKRNLSQKRAQAIVTYLWSQGVSERRIEAEGYGDKYAIGNNNLIHGSALNRRVEIQWTV